MDNRCSNSNRLFFCDRICFNNHFQKTLHGPAPHLSELLIPDELLRTEPSDSSVSPGSTSKDGLKGSKLCSNTRNLA